VAGSARLLGMAGEKIEIRALHGRWLITKNAGAGAGRGEAKWKAAATYQVRPRDKHIGEAIGTVSRRCVIRTVALLGGRNVWENRASGWSRQPP
jgi:hypothetical protein